MSDQTKIKKALEQVRKERSRQFDFRTKQQIAEFTDYQNRQQRTAKTQERLLRKGLDKAGIDLEVLDRLHERDNRVAETFRKRQMTEVQRYALQVAKQRRKISRQMHAFLKKHFGKRIGNPSVTIALKIASDIDVTFSTAGNGSLSDVDFTKAEWDNSARTTMAAGSSSDWGIVGLTISYDFVWVADRTGIAEAVAWFLLDGTYSLWAEGKCTGERGATVSVTGSVEASQPTPGAGTGRFSEESSIVDETVLAECTSRSRSGVIDDESLRVVNQTGIPIAADLPVIVSARLQIYCSASEDARVVVDSATDSLFGLMVPSVVLVVEY
jgi:hypothetical protein